MFLHRLSQAWYKCRCARYKQSRCLGYGLVEHTRKRQDASNFKGLQNIIARNKARNILSWNALLKIISISSTALLRPEGHSLPLGQVALAALSRRDDDGARDDPCQISSIENPILKPAPGLFGVDPARGHIGPSFAARVVRAEVTTLTPVIDIDECEGIVTAGSVIITQHQRLHPARTRTGGPQDRPYFA